jgi:hypothetical protein
MTVQANAAPQGLAWQNTACGSCTRRRTTLPEPKERSKLFCRKSCAEAKELCPADHGLATCTATITARKGRWLAISRLPRRPARPRPRRPRRPGRPGPVPQRSHGRPRRPGCPPDVSPSHAVPRAVAQARPRHPTPSAGRPQTPLPSWGCPRSSSGRPCHPRPSRGPSPRRPVNSGRPRLSREPGLSGHHPPPQPLARRCRPDRGTTVRF